MDPTPYWAVHRLIAAAETNWEGLDGTSATHGLDPGALPLGRFCNYVHVWLAEHMSETQFRMFEIDLATPPVEALTDPDVVEMTAEEEGRAFLAFQAAATGKAVPT